MLLLLLWMLLLLMVVIIKVPLISMEIIRSHVPATISNEKKRINELKSRFLSLISHLTHLWSNGGERLLDRLTFNGLTGDRDRFLGGLREPLLTGREGDLREEKNKLIDCSSPSDPLHPQLTSIDWNCRSWTSSCDRHPSSVDHRDSCVAPVNLSCPSSPSIARGTFAGRSAIASADAPLPPFAAPSRA